MHLYTACSVALRLTTSLGAVPTDIYVTCGVVGSAILAYSMIKFHQHVLLARSGALQYTKLGSDSSRPPAGTALQPLLCEYVASH